MHLFPSGNFVPYNLVCLLILLNLEDLLDPRKKYEGR